MPSSGSVSDDGRSHGTCMEGGRGFEWALFCDLIGRAGTAGAARDPGGHCHCRRHRAARPLAGLWACATVALGAELHTEEEFGVGGDRPVLAADEYTALPRNSVTAGHRTEARFAWSGTQPSPYEVASPVPTRCWQMGPRSACSTSRGRTRRDPQLIDVGYGACGVPPAAGSVRCVLGGGARSSAGSGSASWRAPKRQRPQCYFAHRPRPRRSSNEPDVARGEHAGNRGLEGQGPRRSGPRARPRSWSAAGYRCE